MRNFTKIVLSLAMAFGLLGGVNSVKAGHVKGNLTATGGFETTWDPVTETMGWNSVGNYYPNFRILLTGLPSGDISEYTKFHATLSDFSDNATYVRLRIKDTSDNYADANLVAGENNISFATLQSSYPDCDFTSIADITIWSPGSAEEGKLVDADHPASVKIKNVYLQCVKNVINCTGFGDEFTKMGDITDGTKFVISDGTNVLYFNGDQDGKNSAYANVPYNSYFYYTLTKIDGLDLDGDSEDDDDIYAVNIINEDGTAFPAPYSLGNNINFTNWGSIFSGSAQADKAKGYGTDAQYQGIWKVAYTSSKGFSFKNCSLNKYLKPNGSQDDVFYLKLYKSLGFVVNTDLDKEDNEANDAIFDFADATGYDADTHKFTNGGWTFASPVDMSNWDYLVITTIDNASAASCKISIADNDGKSVTGNQYTGSVAGTGNDMYLDQWNHQNAIRISMDYLRATKGLDISKIKSLTFANNSGGDIVISIANVYLTDYNNTKINGGYATGDLKRDYSATGKFGTICLPYKASCAGAEIYEIAGKTASSVTLAKVTGLLEAGKPYFYVSSDEVGQNNAGTVRNVNFFRADLDTYDAASAGTNNGLVGTFAATTAPMNKYVLSSNQLHKVTSSVNVAANKAYVDMDAIVSSARQGNFELFSDETTGVAEVKAQGENARCEFFNLAGQRVAQPAKGLYIVNGKKVIIK